MSLVGLATRGGQSPASESRAAQLCFFFFHWFDLACIKMFVQCLLFGNQNMKLLTSCRAIFRVCRHES